MMEVVTQLCIKSYELIAKNGDKGVVTQGETYTTSPPDENCEFVIAFTKFWFPVPKSHFVAKEKP